MPTLADLMAAVRDLRDALHDRLDDNLSDRSFDALSFRHTQAALMARREIEQPLLPAALDAYGPITVDLKMATAAVIAATAADEAEILAAAGLAGKALDEVGTLP